MNWLRYTLIALLFLYALVALGKEDGRPVGMGTAATCWACFGAIVALVVTA